MEILRTKIIAIGHSTDPSPNIKEEKAVWLHDTKAAFYSRSHRNVGQHPLSELPLWQRYYAKNHLAFLQKLLWITSNIMELLSECHISLLLIWVAIEIQANFHCHNATLKITQSFSKTLYELHLTIWSIYLKVKIPLLENFVIHHK